MIAEYRALQADIDARRHFTEEKQPIMHARAVIADWLKPDPTPQETAVHSAMNLRTAAESGVIEVG